MDAKARSRRQVVDAVEARHEAVLLAGRVAKPAQHVDDRVAVDDEARLLALVVGAEHRPRADAVELLGDQLEARGVRHQPRRSRAAE